MANMTIHKINRLSRFFPSANLPNPNALETSTIASKSYNHMINYGIIAPVNTGMYAVLPLGLRVLNKLTHLIDCEMEDIGAQKILLPALTATKLWKTTKRYESNKNELFHVTDRQENDYILSPTYEETICDLLRATGPLSKKMLPLRLYQISNKWRDEMRPRMGFLRGREFMMKDLYTFDSTLEDAEKTYELVSEAYSNIFRKIGVPFMKCIGNPGAVGGSISHEYHYLSDIGQDIIYMCPSCDYAINKTVYDKAECPRCNTTLSEQIGSEVGHSFMLETKYTKPLKVVCRQDNKTVPVAMGCFGLGVSRILAVAVEILSTNVELRWPKHLAPFTVCIIPPKKNSKESGASQYIEKVIEILHLLNIDTVLDDRTDLTIGYRFTYDRLMGFPYIIVLGKTAMQSVPVFEVHDVYNSKRCDLPLESISNYFLDQDLNHYESVAVQCS